MIRGRSPGVVGNGKPRLATLLAEPTHPITGQPLKTMAIPVDASILRRVRSELGNGVEYRIGVFTKIISVSTAESTHVLRQNTQSMAIGPSGFMSLGFRIRRTPQNSGSKSGGVTLQSRSTPRYSLKPALSLEMRSCATSKLISFPISLCR